MPSIAYYRNYGKTFKKPRRPFEKERLDAELKVRGGLIMHSRGTSASSSGPRGSKHRGKPWMGQQLASGRHQAAASVAAQLGDAAGRRLGTWGGGSLLWSSSLLGMRAATARAMLAAFD